MKIIEHDTDIERPAITQLSAAAATSIRLLGGPASGMRIPGKMNANLSNNELVAWIATKSGDARYYRFSTDQPEMVYEGIDDDGRIDDAGRTI